MQKTKKFLSAVFVLIMLVSVLLPAEEADAASMTLKKGMSGNAVKALQNDLKTLGVFSANSTGYFGSITEASVKKLQSKYGLVVDGIAGKNTFALIDRLLGRGSTKTAASANTNTVLKFGMSGSNVESLQKKLKTLGYFSANCTGYYGTITKNAVIAFQKAYGLVQDGIAGPVTLSALEKALSKDNVVLMVSEDNAASRGADTRSEGKDKNYYLLQWFGGAENVFAKGTVATVTDVWTGKTFKVKRTFGYNHADTETLTAKDTEIMKSLYGGQWSWARRPIIVDVNGRKMAASMAGMPHAGLDNQPAEKYVSSRSGGYGYGANLDAVKGNNMDGVFDIHFYQSKTHGSNKVDTNHQNAVKAAAEWAVKNY